MSKFSTILRNFPKLLKNVYILCKYLKKFSKFIKFLKICQNLSKFIENSLKLFKNYVDFSKFTKLIYIFQSFKHFKPKVFFKAFKECF